MEGSLAHEGGGRLFRPSGQLAAAIMMALAVTLTVKRLDAFERPRLA